MRTGLIGAAAIFALAACETYDAEEEEVLLLCRGDYEVCIDRCDADFERDRDSWEYRNCTDYCRESGGRICTPDGD